MSEYELFKHFKAKNCPELFVALVPYLIDVENFEKTSNRLKIVLEDFINFKNRT